MDKRNLDAKQSSNEVTEVISRNTRAGHERDYDDWLRRFMMSERQFPGYLGTTIIAPGGNVSSLRYIINRFTNQASLDAWENSEESLKLLEEVNKYSTYQRVTGNTGNRSCIFRNAPLESIAATKKCMTCIILFFYQTTS